MIKVWAIGGYEQVGNSMTAINFGNEKDWIILDMGFWMENLITAESKYGDLTNLPTEMFYELKIVPNDKLFFQKYGKNVKAIIISHAHLDHVGAVTRLATKYKNAKIITTPFTHEVLNFLDENKSVKNKRVYLNTGVIYQITEKTQMELIRVTHSIPSSTAIALYNDQGNVLYMVDWKFDNNPQLGKKIDYNKLKKIGKEGCKILFTDTTRVERIGKTPSERIARVMLESLLNYLKDTNRLIVYSTFSSHIARLKYVIELAKQLGREPILIGRSLRNYTKAAKRANIVDLSKKAKILKNGKELRKLNKKIKENRENYFLIVTGHQGEPNSVLERISKDEHPIKLKQEDIVILGSEPIPALPNLLMRGMLEERLLNKGVRLFTNVHVSGHAYSEDLKDLAKMIQPEYYIPTHGELNKNAKAIELLRRYGYEASKNAFLIGNNHLLELE